MPSDVDECIEDPNLCEIQMEFARINLEVMNAFAGKVLLFTTNFAMISVYLNIFNFYFYLFYFFQILMSVTCTAVNYV